MSYAANGYFDHGARRRRRKRRRAGAQAAGIIIRRTALAALLAAALSLLLAAAGYGKKQYGVRLQYADEHSEARPDDASDTLLGAGYAEPLFTAQPAKEPGAETDAASPQSAVTAEYRLDSPIIKVSVNGQIFEMDIEEYIVGVVAAEMSVSAEPEALKAQAVAARTFTSLHKVGGAKCTRGAEGCTVCSDPGCCQAYRTDEQLRAAWGESYEANINKIRAAVYDTRGVVVTYNGRLISALYHASSGPATENSEAVFAVAQPYLVSVASLEGDAEMVSVQEFSAAELIERINSAYPDAGLSLPLNKKDIDVWGRTESGRVQLVQAGSTVLTGGQMRSLLGLKSTDFTVEIKDGTVLFTCIGYGHGVGMSQYGAIAMAKQGSTYKDILLHYYTGTELASLRYGE